MSERAPAAYVPKNELRKFSKLPFEIRVLIIHHFAHAIPVAVTARETGVTAKTVRAGYLHLRGRLTAPRFARWHRANRRLLTMEDESEQEAIRDAFFATLAQCWGNRTCQRNWEAGNRTHRLCEKCPLDSRFSDERSVAEALVFIDAIRDLYRRLGIGTERKGDPVGVFKLRALHTATLATVAQNAKRLPSGLFDPADESFLSFRSLFEALVADLCEENIDDVANMA